MSSINRGTSDTPNPFDPNQGDQQAENTPETSNSGVLGSSEVSTSSSSNDRDREEAVSAAAESVLSAPLPSALPPSTGASGVFSFLDGLASLGGGVDEDDDQNAETKMKALFESVRTGFEGINSSIQEYQEVISKIPRSRRAMTGMMHNGERVRYSQDRTSAAKELKSALYDAFIMTRQIGGNAKNLYDELRKLHLVLCDYFSEEDFRQVYGNQSEEALSLLGQLGISLYAGFWYFNDQGLVPQAYNQSILLDREIRAFLPKIEAEIDSLHSLTCCERILISLRSLVRAAVDLFNAFYQYSLFTIHRLIRCCRGKSAYRMQRRGAVRVRFHPSGVVAVQDDSRGRRPLSERDRNVFGDEEDESQIRRADSDSMGSHNDNQHPGGQQQQPSDQDQG